MKKCNSECSSGFIRCFLNIITIIILQQQIYLVQKNFTKNAKVKPTTVDNICEKANCE